jgi:flagellar biosynthesis protein FliP
VGGMKLKRKLKFICKISLLLAAFFLTITFALAQKQTTYASQLASGQTDASTNNGSTSRTPGTVDATKDENNGLSISYNNDSGQISGTVKIFLVLTILSLAPSILIMLTSFTRIIIVLHFLRQAIGTQTAPPNQVLVGLALFLTLFIMSPIFIKINTDAIKPLDEGKITQEQALERGMQPLREFMYGQTQKKDLALFCDISKTDYPKTDKEAYELPIAVVIPSFLISELRTAFIIGFLIYIPFIIIDMVVASVLMSMGMMMLPPTTISLPFKILLFILADGWNLVIGNLVKTFI